MPPRSILPCAKFTVELQVLRPQLNHPQFSPYTWKSRTLLRLDIHRPLISAERIAHAMGSLSVASLFSEITEVCTWASISNSVYGGRNCGRMRVEAWHAAASAPLPGRLRGISTHNILLHTEMRRNLGSVVTSFTKCLMQRDSIRKMHINEPSSCSDMFFHHHILQT